MKFFKPRHRPSTPATLLMAAVTLALLACTSGCVSLGNPMGRVDLPPGAPPVKEVLKSLADNEAAMQSFQATGTIMVKIPEVEATQVSRESVLQYRSPGSLHVIGRRYGTRILVLTYVNDAFLIEFPTRREYCHREQAQALGSLSSADIVREMFQPEDWQRVSPKLLQMVSYDEAAQTAVLILWEDGDTPWRKRILKVQGAPWVIQENTLLNKEGVEIASTRKSGYHEQSAIRYPTEIECTFPGEEAWMRFVMRRVDVNPQLDPALFDIPAQVNTLKNKSFSQVDLFQGEGPSLEDISELNQP